jgi:hypothetical protein
MDILLTCFSAFMSRLPELRRAGSNAHAVPRVLPEAGCLNHNRTSCKPEAMLCNKVRDTRCGISAKAPSNHRSGVVAGC